MRLVDQHFWVHLVTGGAADESHVFGHFEGANQALKPIACCGIFDFTGDSAMRGVRQEDEVASRYGEIGG